MAKGWKMTKNMHGEWKQRADDERKYGQPPPPFPQCSYCGSITPEAFIEACRLGYRMEVADWKYGWPHKVYIDWPNPNPDEIRQTGERCVGGKTVEVIKGKYQTLYLKFYTIHLKDFEALAEHAQLILSRIGILFEHRDGEIYYRTIPKGKATS